VSKGRFFIFLEQDPSACCELEGESYKKKIPQERFFYYNQAKLSEQRSRENKTL
jgi:hypothetical protein